MTSTPDQSSDIKHLNSFLRGEISARETYQQALSKAQSLRSQAILRDNLNSHSSRVNLLNAEIRRRGGEPAEGSGPWGAVARAVEGGAKLFGESTAVAALEAGEDHGLADYRRDEVDLTPQARELVRSRLLPEQERTHSAISMLKTILE